jgi:hypothetical protein
MFPRVLYRGIPVHVAQLSQTESVAIVTGVRETVHCHGSRMTVEHFAYAAIELVVGDRRPEGWHVRVQLQL